MVIITTMCSINCDVDVWEPSADLMYTIRGAVVPAFLDVKASLMFNTRIIKLIYGFFMWFSYHYVILFFIIISKRAWLWAMDAKESFLHGD